MLEGRPRAHLHALIGTLLRFFRQLCLDRRSALAPVTRAHKHTKNNNKHAHICNHRLNMTCGFYIYMNFNAKYTPQPVPFFSLIAFSKSSLCCFSPCMLFLHVSWSLNVYILPCGMNEAFYCPSRAFDFETENGCLSCACVHVFTCACFE